MGHFPLSADLVNGEGGQYWTLPDSRSLAKWLFSFNKPTKTITETESNTEAKKDKKQIFLADFVKSASTSASCDKIRSRSVETMSNIP